MQKYNKEIKLSDIEIGERFNSINTQVVQKIKKSIDSNGLINPITLLYLGNGKYQLLAGYHRFTALRELGILESDAIILKSLTEAQAKIIELEENVARNQFDHFILGTLVNHLDKLYLEQSTKKVDDKKKPKNKEVVDKTGVNEREVQRARKLHKELESNPELVEHLNTKSSSLTNEDMKRVASMSKDKQDRFIELTKDNLDKKSASESVKTIEIEIEKEKETQRLQNLKNITKDVCYFGDSLDILRSTPENYFSHCITDLPYGISVKKEMGKKASSCKVEEWDKDIPTFELFKEIFRTIKPGGFFVTTFSPRSDLNLKLLDKLREVGFDIKFNQMYWVHEANLPRSRWVGNKLKESHKKGEHKDIPLKTFQGEKTPNVAPSVEPIIIVQKPFEGGRIDHAIKAINDPSISKGTINIEDTIFNKRQAQQLISLNKINDLLGDRFSIENWSQKVLGDMLYVSQPHNEKNYNYKGEKLELENLNNNEKSNDHASVKPVALYAYLLKLFNTDKEGIILEPFAGSGTTLIASKLLGMNYCGIEQDKGYYEITKKRLIQEKTYTVSDIKKI